MRSAPAGIALLLVGALSGRLTVTSILHDHRARRARRTRLLLPCNVRLTDPAVLLGGSTAALRQAP